MSFFSSPASGEPSLPLLVNQYQRIKGSPVETAREVLENLFSVIPRESVKGIRICGSGAGLIGDILNIKHENEFRAIAHAVGLLYPDISTVFEMGGQNAKFLTLTSGID